MLHHSGLNVLPKGVRACVCTGTNAGAPIARHCARAAPAPLQPTNDAQPLLCYEQGACDDVSCACVMRGSWWSVQLAAPFGRRNCGMSRVTRRAQTVRAQPQRAAWGQPSILQRRYCVCIPFQGVATGTAAGRARRSCVQGGGVGRTCAAIMPFAVITRRVFAKTLAPTARACVQLLKATRRLSECVTHAHRPRSAFIVDLG